MSQNPVVQLLADRKRTRALKSTRISAEVIAELKEAIRLTPSCRNNQPWRFVFADSEQGREGLASAITGGNVAWASRAGLLVVGWAKAEDDCRSSGGREYYSFDLGMAAMNLMLAATYQGLSARPMAGFDPEVIRDLYGLQEANQPLVMVAIGEPDPDDEFLPESAKASGRKPSNT